MRVLVTGATGFVGRVTIARLRSEGHHVTALVHIRPGHFESDVLIRRADLLDANSIADAISGAEAVIHLAADARNHAPGEDPLRSFRHNMCGTMNLLDGAVTGATCRVIIFVSTSLVYGDGHAEAVTEDSPTRPVGAYAASKLSAEYALRAVVNQGRIGATILRSCNVAGAVGGIRDEDRSRLVPMMMGTASGSLADARLLLDTSAAREFLHVDDLARALCLSLENTVPGRYRVYNVGTGRPVRLVDLVRYAEDISGRQIPRTSRSGPTLGTLLLDSRRIADELGWYPERAEPKDILHDAWAAEEIRSGRR